MGGRFLMGEVPLSTRKLDTSGGAHRGAQAVHARRMHQPSERDQIVSLEPLELYHRSPDYGELQCKPRELKRAI